MSHQDDRAREKQYREYLKSELGAAAIYSALAEAERDAARADVFERLVQAEMRHAARWAEKLGIDADSLEPKGAGLKLLLVRWAAKSFGIDRVLPILVREEAKEIGAYASDPEAQDIAREEHQHARVLRGLADGSDPSGMARATATGTSGRLRAAVLGVNDGLVSNFSLVMGVAGGTGAALGTGSAEFVLLAGVAGLLAGAFSMAAGEYVSMRSQRDIYEHELTRERLELQLWPEEEQEELELIYRAKGMSPEESRLVAKRLMADPEVALDTMAREELGLDPTQLGSPWGASISSFVAFVAGAIVPILPYIFNAGRLAFSLSAVLSAAALASVGGLMATMSGRNPAWGSLRMLLAGGAAAAVTFGVGRLVGVSLS